MCKASILQYTYMKFRSVIFIIFKFLIWHKCTQKQNKNSFIVHEFVNLLLQNYFSTEYTVYKYVYYIEFEKRFDIKSIIIVPADIIFIPKTVSKTR